MKLPNFVETSMKITCVGDCGVDYYIDHKLLRPGGITLNFAVHARNIFPKKDIIQIVTALGKNKEAKIVKTVFKKYHLIPYVTQMQGNTPIQYINHDKRGEKKFIKYDEGVLADFRINEQNSQIINKSDVVMTVIYSQIVNFFSSVVPNRPKKIMAVDFMDLADFDKRVDIVKKYIHQFDIGFFGLRSHEKKLLKDLQNLAKKYHKLFVITLGPNGSTAYNSSKIYFASAVPVKKIVDTTGAGDAFAAAFLKKYLYSGDVQKGLEYGNKFAAKIVQMLGSF